MQSLKNRLIRVEALLRAAGILQETNSSKDFLSGEEEEDSLDEESQSSPSSSSHLSSGSFNNSDAMSFPGGDDVEVSSIFTGHKSDESRYFGSWST